MSFSSQSFDDSLLAADDDDASMASIYGRGGVMDSFGCDVDVSAQTHTQCNRFRNRRKVLRLCECTTKDEDRR